MMKRTTVVGALAVGLLLSTAAYGQTLVWHDPWLNWDIWNNTGQLVNDFEIVVDNGNFTLDPNDPGQVFMGGWTGFTTYTTGTDTVLSWSGQNVGAGGVAHLGGWMEDSGPILDAYWTLDGVRVGGAIAIPYELTGVWYGPDPAPDPNWPPAGPGEEGIFMALETSSAAMEELGTNQAYRMSGIRTWSDLDAGGIGLHDLTTGLNLNGDPRLAGKETEPSETEFFLIDSFFDVFVDITPNIGPQWESLLYSQVDLVDTSGVLPPVPVVRFWNLNPQTPEPGTLSLLVLGGLALLRRRRN